MVLDGKSSQKYADSILKTPLPDDVICDIAIYAVDTTHYSKCDQVSDM